MVNRRPTSAQAHPDGLARKRIGMITRAMKIASIAVLMLSAIFWDYLPPFGLAMRFVVSVSAFLVAKQAGAAGKRYWVAGFYAIAVIFNPLLPLFRPAGGLSFLLVCASAATFAVSLYKLKSRPLLSIPSITDRTPGSESL
jgi:hypothetical protein